MPASRGRGARRVDYDAIDSDVTPDADDTRDLGSASKQWAYLWAVIAMITALSIGGYVKLSSTGGILLINASTHINGSLTAGLSQDSPVFFLNSTSGKLGIGTTFPSHKLEVAGSMNVSGDVNISSACLSGNCITSWDKVNFSLAGFGEGTGWTNDSGQTYTDLNVNVSGGLYVGERKEGYCYQETANVSTSCGGLATGEYSYTGTWFGLIDEAFDGNWSNYAQLQGDEGYIFFNYTKPTLATNFSLWQVLGAPEGTIYNVSIKQSCWDYHPDTLMLAFYGAVFGNDIFKCYDGAWQTIKDAGISNVQCAEEAMFWHFNNSYSMIINSTDASFPNGIELDTNIDEWNDVCTLCGLPYSNTSFDISQLAASADVNIIPYSINSTDSIIAESIYWSSVNGTVWNCTITNIGEINCT